MNSYVYNVYLVTKKLELLRISMKNVTLRSQLLRTKDAQNLNPFIK